MNTCAVTIRAQQNHGTPQQSPARTLASDGTRYRRVRAEADQPALRPWLGGEVASHPDATGPIFGEGVAGIGPVVPRVVTGEAQFALPGYPEDKSGKEDQGGE